MLLTGEFFGISSPLERERGTSRGESEGIRARDCTGPRAWWDGPAVPADSTCFLHWVMWRDMIWLLGLCIISYRWKNSLLAL